jgi:DNA-binding NtrC family response regulator
MVHFGYDPLWAANPIEALRHLRFEPVDAFVCDLGRPLHMDRNLIRNFHEASPRVPILLFSPVQSLEEESLAARYGTLLYKPMDRLALVEALGRLLAARAQRPAGPSAEMQPTVPLH